MAGERRWRLSRRQVAFAPGEYPPSALPASRAVQISPDARGAQPTPPRPQPQASLKPRSLPKPVTGPLMPYSQPVISFSLWIVQGVVGSPPVPMACATERVERRHDLRPVRRLLERRAAGLGRCCRRCSSSSTGDPPAGVSVSVCACSLPAAVWLGSHRGRMVLHPLQFCARAGTRA